MSQPDWSYEVMDSASLGKVATVYNLRHLNKVIDKATKETGTIKISRMGELEDLKILAMTVGGLKRREDMTQSVAGRIIFLSNMNEINVSPLMWKLKKIQSSKA